MNAREVIDSAGGIDQVTQKLGFKDHKDKMKVRQWYSRNSIPASYVLALADMSGVHFTEIDPCIYPPERFKNVA